MSPHKFPPGLPPIKGIIAQLRFMSELSRDFMGFLVEKNRQYGDVFQFQVGDFRQYVITDPDLIHEVLVAQSAKFQKDMQYTDTRRGLARFLGNGLLTSNGEFWKRQRRLVAPSLHARRIESYAETMVDYALDTVNGWQDNTRLDISQEMNRLTMRIVGKTLFNADVAGDVRDVASAMGTIQHYFAESRSKLLPTWIPTPFERRARQASGTLNEISYRLIEAWRQTREDRGDLLSMLLMAEDEDGNHMTDEQARDELVTLFLAGHETTANALNWTWYLLAQNPEAEAKLHAELDSVLGGKPPTLDDLKRLPYTEMVVKEALRLYPPAFGFGRVATEDLEIGGYFVPKDTVVAITSYIVHHSPKWWDEPEAFRPERFTPENEAKQHRYAYVPFGGGPRVCIGNSFAMMEAQLLLATIASRYQFRLQPGQMVEMLPLITLNPKDGLPMTAQQRQPVMTLEPILA
ncbi:MAG: cytochrome P450 [Anaerolineaceae bacterium]|nr:cytochrome P450 [Anaerolineaceae bacterium]